MSVGDASLCVQDALSCVAAEVSPEVPDAITACQALDRLLWDLVAGYRALARACREYAEFLYDAHAAAEHELTSLVEWTAGIQAGGALLSVVTVGISELAAQGSQAGHLAATAAKLAAVLDRLSALTAAAAETVTAIAARVDQIRYDLGPLLAARITVAVTETVETLPAAHIAEALAEQRLAAAGVRTETSEAATALKRFPESARGSPKPPSFDPRCWEWRSASSRGSGMNWWDPEGGEWRYHAADKHHRPHWDYNPWIQSNSPWQHIYEGVK